MAFTFFSLGMAVARLGGDVLNSRLGAAVLLRAGMALVAVVLGGVLVIGHIVPAVIGFALCGLGIANAVPLLFSAAGRHDPPGPSLAAAFTLGYTGFIVGPPVIGFVADRAGLPWTLSLLVAAALAVTALGGRATS
jgi:MFS family permease